MAPWHHVFVRTGVVLAALAAFLSVGFLGVYRYVDGYWLYRGFPRPHDPAFVHLFRRAVRMAVARAAHGGWETFVAHELVRAVDARFRTIPSDRTRGIGGLSEGGYGAINIAIHHPGEFGLVESWSGYEKADDLGSIFGHQRALLVRNTPLDTLGSAAAALRRP